MKNLTILFVIFLVFSSGLFAQDYIHLRDQQKRIAAKNIKITAAEIRYENYGADDGQVYIINPDQVNLITYENGEVRLLQKKAKIINTYDFKKNLITFHLFDLVISNFTISYERIISNGKVGIQIPFSLGYATHINVNNDFVISKFYSGLNFNFYPTGQGKIRYFLGPGIRVGTGHDNHDNNNNNDNQTNPDSFYGKLLINNGVIFSPIQQLSLAAVLSLGVRYFPEAGQYNEEVKSTAAFSFNLSYRF